MSGYGHLEGIQRIVQKKKKCTKAITSSLVESGVCIIISITQYGFYEDARS